MALKAVLENLEGVDDALKPLYAETEAGFALQIEGLDAHPELAPLKNAYERTKADKAEAAKRAKELSDKIAELEKGKPDEAALLQLRQDLEAERDRYRGEVETLRGQLTGVTRDRAIIEALASAGVTDATAQKLAARYLSDAVKVDGDKIVVDTDMGPIPVADHVKRWAAGEGKIFVAPPSGAGAKGNSGNAAGAKSMPRAQFEALSPEAKSTFAREGGVLTD